MTQLHGFLYAAADVYFSAITPSATGGQPASLYFMKKDGLPFYLSSAALVLNLAMYNAAIVLIGIVCMVLCPGLFLQFNLPCKVLILIGYVALTGLMAGFLLLLRKGDWIKAIGGALILLFHKLHLLRKPDRLIQRLDRLVKNYGECAALFLGDKALLRNAFFYNLAQRACQIAVSSCIFVCIGGNPAGNKGLYPIPRAERRREPIRFSRELESGRPPGASLLQNEPYSGSGGRRKTGPVR